MARIEKLSSSGLYFASLGTKKAADKQPSATKPQEAPERLTGALYALSVINSALINKDGLSNIDDIVSENKKIISKLENKVAREFFKEVNLISPEKCSVLLNNNNINRYCNFEYGMLSDECSPRYNVELNIFKNAIDKVDIEGIKHVINSVEQRKKNVHPTAIINGIILYSNDKEAFEYVVHSPVIKESNIYLSGFSKDLCKLILDNSNPDSVNAIRYNTVIEMEKGIKDEYDYSLYTRCSDVFIERPKEVENMHNHLENCIAENDFTVYRGEKSPWIFDSVPIDENMQKQARMFACLNHEAKKDLVYPNNQQFSNRPNQTIYDYIINRDVLTLADAMLVAKYGSQEFVDSVIDKINCSSIENSRFISYTLSEKFAKCWARKKYGISSKNNMLSVITKTNIKKGSQVAYEAKSGQYEFIVNDNPKTETFSNARYDKETNTFYIDSVIEPKESIKLSD